MGCGVGGLVAGICGVRLQRRHSPRAKDSKIRQALQGAIAKRSGPFKQPSSVVASIFLPSGIMSANRCESQANRAFAKLREILRKRANL